MKSITFGAEEQEGFLGYENNVLADWKKYLPSPLWLANHRSRLHPACSPLFEGDRTRQSTQPDFVWLNDLWWVVTFLRLRDLLWVNISSVWFVWTSVGRLKDLAMAARRGHEWADRLAVDKLSAAHWLLRLDCSKTWRRHFALSPVSQLYSRKEKWAGWSKVQEDKLLLWYPSTAQSPE